MAKQRKPCGRPVIGGSCRYERAVGKQRCIWHWLLSQPMDVQEARADRRLAEVDPALVRPRVPKMEWPDQERWCSGCQSFVPLFYTSGSRCKACASRATHRARIAATYEISAEEYDELFKLQGGRCYICRRTARSRRLAVDHDHDTNEVRGLLCSDSERGCNHAILGNIRDVDMARRIVEYLEDPPMARLRRGEKPEDPAVAAPWSGLQPSPGTETQPAPF